MSSGLPVTEGRQLLCYATHQHPDKAESPKPTFNLGLSIVISVVLFTLGSIVERMTISDDDDGRRV